jgi:hypothetical protein
MFIVENLDAGPEDNISNANISHTVIFATSISIKHSQQIQRQSCIPGLQFNPKI